MDKQSNRLLRFMQKLWEDEEAAETSSIATEDGLESFLLLKAVTFDDTKVAGGEVPHTSNM